MVGGLVRDRGGPPVSPTLPFGVPVGARVVRHWCVGIEGINRGASPHPPS